MNASESQELGSPPRALVIFRAFRADSG